MDKKTCNHCGKNKLLSQFNKLASSSDGLQPRCRDCDSDYHKKLYDSVDGRRKKSIRLASNRWMSKNKAKLDELKNVPCADCGQMFPPVVMDFHHESGEKEDNISRLFRMASWDRVLKELDKCIIVCSNCHRIRSFMDNG